MIAPVRKVSLPRPLKHQVPILTHPARFKVCNCGRRFGKTYLGLIAVLTGHGPRGAKHWKGALDGGVIWWVTKSDKVARKVWRDLKRALKGWPGLAKREDERRVEFPGGGLVEVRSAHDPESLRGDGLDGVVIDEAAFCHADTWTVLRPALADKQGWCIFISTPNGQNWFFEEFQYAEQDPEYARWHLPSSANESLAASEIEAMRRKMGRHKFARECLAEFITAGGGMFLRDWAKFYERGSSSFIVDGQSYPAERMIAFVTADLAVSTQAWADYTVAVAWAKMKDDPSGRLFVLDVVREKVEGPQVVPLLSRFLTKHGARQIWFAEFGPLVALVQEARHKNLPVHSVNLPPGMRRKVEKAEPLAAAIESGRVVFPRGAEWFETVFVELTGFPDPDMHDDIVDAMAIGPIAAPPPPESPKSGGQQQSRPKPKGPTFSRPSGSLIRTKYS